MKSRPERDDASTKSHILAVGSTDLENAALAELLTGHHYSVSTAPESEDPLSCLRNQSFDLAIIDTTSQKFNGFDLCLKIKQEPDLRSVPVLLLASLSIDEDIVNSLQCGADFFVATPYNSEYLVSSIAAVFSGEYQVNPGEQRSQLPILLAGKKHAIPADRHQILNLLISTYENSVERKRELHLAQLELKERNLQLRDQTKKLALSEQNLRMLLEDNADGMVVLDLKNRVCFANSAAKALLGWCDDNAIGTPFGFSVTPGTTAEVAISCPNREAMIAELKVAYTIWQGETAYLASLHDITQRRMQEEKFMEQHAQLQVANAQLQVLAALDGLTGLNNRRTFIENLDEEFQTAKELGASLSLSLLDVDHFKSYNDTYGHAAGDEVLIAVARTLSGAARKSDFVARYGGEEFVVLLPGCCPSNAVAQAERIRRIIEGASWPQRAITASFGVASVTSDHANPAALIAAADAALYHSKQNGRNRVTHSNVLQLTAGGT